MAKRLPIETPKTRRQKQKKGRKISISPLQKQLFAGLLFGLSVALLLVGIWHGTRLDRFQIDNITVSGGETINPNIIKKQAEEILSGTYFGLIPKTFTFLYPRDRIIREIEAIPRVKKIKADRESLGLLNIQFEEYRPRALWCGVEEGSSCLFIDETGQAFAQAPALLGSALHRLVRDTDQPEVGRQIFDQTFISDLLAATEAVEYHLHRNVARLRFTSDHDLVFELSDGAQILIALDKEPLKTSLDNLWVIIESDEFSHLKQSDFEYIDLRFGDRVFIKEEEEELMEEERENDAEADD